MLFESNATVFEKITKIFEKITKKNIFFTTFCSK